MNPEPLYRNLEHDLDRVHELARRRFLERDIDAYLSIFSDQVSYRQLDGKVVGFSRLHGDVSRQLHSITAADWKFERHTLEVLNGSPIEVLTQSGYVATTAFGLLHRIWKLFRRGRYSWTREGSDWKIISVEIESETIQAVGIQFGWRPHLPSEPVNAA